MYLKTNPNPGDIIMFDEIYPTLQGKTVIVVDETEILNFHTVICNFVMRYITVEVDEPVIYYPQKSYAVALIYAKLLEKYFDEPFYEALDNPTLLLGDKYFKQYSERRLVYDRAIHKITKNSLWDFENIKTSRVQATVDYFRKEFLLADTV